MTFHPISSRAILSILIATALFSHLPGANAQTQGLSSRQPIGAFLNNLLPTSAPGSGGAFIVEDAFPGLTFVDPIKMVQQPDSSFMWVICRAGQVWRFDKNSPTTTKTLMLDLGSTTFDGGDSGMLGIALHPQFGRAGSANRGYLYLCYGFHPSGSSGNLSYDRLSRFTLADNATSIAPSSELVMINQFDEQEWHNGGDIFFGTDSFLYISIGDEGALGEPYNNAQRINVSLFSGVLRIDVDQDATRSHPIHRQPLAGASLSAVPAGWPATFTQGYFIPNDNPWVDPSGAVLEEFYAIGLRSPHRMSFDGQSGKAFIGDVGQESVEEIDILEKGANYQWSYREGTIAGPKPKPASVIGTETPPLYSYATRAEGNRCVIGGYVYRGSRLPGTLQGKYIFGDYYSGRIWSLDWQTPGAQPVLLTQIGASQLTGFSVDANNEIYYTTLGSAAKISRLSPWGGAAEPPATLSATGAFASLATLTPATGIVPFNVNSPLWSDGAFKQRWIALPNDGAPYTSSEVVAFNAKGGWSFPVGTVLIKHFELAVNDNDPSVRKRMETRFMVRGTDGWYGVTYKWRADGSDADLLANGENMSVTFTGSGGTTRTQNWTFPSRGDCLSCHSPAAGFALGLSTRQLNGDFTYPSTNTTANQLATWSAIGMFDAPLTSAQIAGYDKSVPMNDTTASLEHRVRSYLDANCAHCHRPGGVRANYDARFDTPIEQTSIVNGPLYDELGITGAKVIVPQQISRSMMHVRANSLTEIKMPPLAKNVVDTVAVSTIAQWINSLPAATNAPPTLLQPVNQSTMRGALATLQLQASDADGNLITYSASGLPLGLSINPATGLINGTVSTMAAATNIVTVSASDGLLNISKNFIWITGAPPTTPTLTPQDVGEAGLIGSTTLSSNGTFTLKGAGADIFFAADGFQFACTQLSGDGEIRARVISQTNTNPWAKAGVMIRENLTAGSRHAMMMVTPVNGFGMILRAATDEASTYAAGPRLNVAPNNWVRLVRAGNSLTGYSSADGTIWTEVFTFTLTNLPANAYIGLAVTATTTSALSTAVFDNVQYTGGSILTNQTPVLVQPANQSTMRGALASLQLQASDADGNILTYSAIGLPLGLSINPVTGLISGMVSITAAATNTVTVSASDGSLSNSKSFVWTTAAAPNHAPVLTQPAAQSTARGNPASLQLQALDADSSLITYSASGLPLGLSINPVTGLISGTVSTTATATNNVTVSASDGSLSNSKTFIWSTTAASIVSLKSITLTTFINPITSLSATPINWNRWLSSHAVTTDNSDGDYKADLLEYALGEDPHNGLGDGGLHLLKDGDGKFGAQFTIATGVSDLTYGVETSVDFIKWTPLNIRPITIAEPDGGHTVTYSAIDALLGTSDTTVFFRMRVTHPQSGLSVVGEPLSLQRVSFVAGSQTYGYANVKAPIYAGRLTEMPAMLKPSCYLEVRDGPLAGHRYEIGIDGGIDPASPLNTSLTPPDPSALIVVRQHVSLNDALDKTKFFSALNATLATTLSFYNGAGYVNCWLYNATPADPTQAIWVSADDTSLADAGGIIIEPGEGMFIKSIRNTSMIVGGHLRTNPFVQVVRPGQMLLAQAFPSTGSAISNGFNATNGLVASAQILDADQLLIWGGDTPARTATFTNYWYAQTGSTGLWFNANSSLNTDQSGALLFQAHRAFFLKRSSAATTIVLIPNRWNLSP
ncbi:MAG: putative Ig domain-containing protein [Verrucomicrobia bacterium]|nr:putative Ig domain-containing protein [Verrucomicrobiota bacterium]